MSIGINGYGTKPTVTSTASRVVLNSENTSFYANHVSVYNDGTVDIYALVNCTLDHFNNHVATAVPIPSKGAFSFTSDGRAPIHSICLKSSGADCVVYLGAF